MSEIQEQNKDKEVAEKYIKGEISLESLTEGQVDLAFDIMENSSEEETEPVEEPETTEPEETQKEEETPKEDFGIKPIDENLKVKESLEEANRYKQLFEDRESKLKSLKEDESYRRKFFGEDIVTKVDPDKDYLNDEHLAKVDTLEQKQKLLEERLAQYEERDKENQANTALKQEQLSIFKEINKMQDSYSALKTSQPFQEIDTKFVDFDEKAKIGGVDSRRYLSDKKYREAAIAQGYKLDISESDMAKADKIYSYHDKYLEDKKAGYRTSLSRVFVESPDYEEYMKGKYAGHTLADDDALEKKIAENSQEVKVMGPGSNGSVSDADVERIVNEMKVLSMKTAFTDKDEKRYQELEKMLENINIG